LIHTHTPYDQEALIGAVPIKPPGLHHQFADHVAGDVGLAGTFELAPSLGRRFARELGSTSCPLVPIRQGPPVGGNDQTARAVAW
jgi:hypothetical protein